MTHLRSGTVVWQGTTITGYTQGTTTTTRTSATGFTTLWDTNSAPNDDASQLVPIGFPFQFYGNWYGEVHVSTNGYITFTNASTLVGNNTALPASGAPNNLIAVLWDDLIVQPSQGSADRISYTTTGTAPNRRFIVDYNSVSRVGQSTSYVYGQIVLNEGTHVIELLYDGINSAGWVGMSVTQGIEDSTGANAVQISGSPNISSIPTSNYSFTPTTTTSSIDDGGSSALPLGFSFSFYGSTYTQVWACTNGYISFSNADITDFSNDAIPSTITPNNYIGPFWDDLYMDSNGLSTLVWYSTLGTAPNRVFTIEYYGSRHISQSASEYTGQVVLVETSNRIECHYPTAAGLNAWYANGSATIGIEDAGGNNGSAVPGTPTIRIPPTTNFRWDPQPSSFTPVASAVSAVSAPVTVGTFNTFQVSRSIQNTGSSAGMVNYDIVLSLDTAITASDTIVYSGVTSSIAAGATDTATDTCTAPAASGGPYYVGLLITATNTAVSTSADVTVSNVFTAQSISVVGAPVTRADGDSFQITRSILNTGGTAGTTPYQIYISTDANITTTDRIVFSGTTASIAAGGTDTQTDTCTIPSGTPTGNYYAGLFIGTTNTAATTAADVTVVRRFQPTAVSAVGAPITVNVGATFQVSRSIQNNGTTAGSVPYEIRLSTNTIISTGDTLVFSGTTPSIAGGATNTQTDTCTANLGAGTYYVGLRLPAYNTYVASTVTQVTVVQPFTANAVAAVGAPVSVGQGGTFQVNRTIGNTGTTAGTIPYRIYLSTNNVISTGDTLVFQGTSPSIAGGGTDTASVTCTVPASLSLGNYYVGLYIDSSNLLSTATTEVTIAQPFAPQALSVITVGAPITVNAGGSFQITRAIQNTGGLPGTANYTIYLSSDASITTSDIAVFTGSTLAIAAGATDMATDTCTAPAAPGGPYYVGLYIAAGNTAVTPAQDVTVTNFSPQAQSISVVGAPATVVRGQTFEAVRSIQNSGTVAGTTNYEIRLSTDTTIDGTDILVFSSTTPSIPAAGTDTATDTCTVPAGATVGPYYVGLIVLGPPQSTAATTAQDVNVVDPFTPIAQSLAVTGAPVTIDQTGGTFQASRSIQNTGGVAGIATFEIVLSTDTTYDAADLLVFTGATASIAAGATETLTETCMVQQVSTPGNYYAILYISMTPSESATANQDVVINDFYPMATAVSPLNVPVRVPAGGSFQVSRTISNMGTAAGTVAYEIYLSTDVTITSADILLHTGTTASIPGSGTDTNAVTLTVPASLAVDLDYYVGLYLSATNTAASVDWVRVLPDFARFNALSVVEASSQVNINENLQIQVEIENTGGVPGAATYTVYLSTDGTIDSSDRELLQDVSPFIPVEGTDTSPVVVTIPGDVQAGTYWVGIRITSPNVQTETAVSGGISVLVPRDDDDGSCGGGPDGGSLWAFLPLALLAAICLAVRRRKMALER
jgi:uncharacterized membrane protein